MAESKSKRKSRKIEYADPEVRIGELTDEEVRVAKVGILKTYAETLDRARACKVADITPRELALLEASDREFKEKLRAIEAGDDVVLVDKARSVMQKALGSDTEGIKLRAAQYILERKGGWASQSKQTVEDDRPSVHPPGVAEQFSPPAKLRLANGSK